MPKNQLKNTVKMLVSNDGGLGMGGRDGCSKKSVSLEVVRCLGNILEEELTAFYDRLSMVFEKMRDDFKIFETKQYKTETLKIKLQISGTEIA